MSAHLDIRRWWGRILPPTHPTQSCIDRHRWPSRSAADAAFHSRRWKTHSCEWTIARWPRHSDTRCSRWAGCLCVAEGHNVLTALAFVRFLDTHPGSSCRAWGWGCMADSRRYGACWWSVLWRRASGFVETVWGWMSSSVVWRQQLQESKRQLIKNLFLARRN